MAAALKSREQTSNGDSINLTEFQFDPNPRTFKPEITRGEYSVTVDLIANRLERYYFIECKSTTSPNKVLKPSSEEFLDGLLEFVALNEFRKLSDWDIKFLLCSNCPVSVEVAQLLEEQPFHEIRKLRLLLLEAGRRKHGIGFRGVRISSRNIVETLKNTRAIEFPDRFLKELTRDEGFKANLEAMTEQLKRFRPDSSGGGQIISRTGTIYLLCDSDNHDLCEEQLSQNFLCHIGKCSNLIRRLVLFHSDLGSPLICVIPSKQVGYTTRNVRRPAGCTSRETSDALTHSLNALATGHGIRDLFFDFVPGTLDVVVAKKKELAELIYNSQTAPHATYDLGKVIELHQLGESLAVELSIRVLKDVYNVNTDESNYLVQLDSPQTSIS